MLKSTTVARAFTYSPNAHAKALYYAIPHWTLGRTIHSTPFCSLANNAQQLTQRTPQRRPLIERSILATGSRARTFTSTSANMSDTVKAISSYDEFKQIINEDKVAAIDFWATWCGPCKMISPMFEKFAGEAPADKIAFYKVDVDEQEQIAAECGISAMPTFVFFKKGEKLTQVVGAVPQQLQAAIKKFH